MLLMRFTSAQAQFIGGSSFTGKDSLVATWSGNGSAASIGFAALGMNPPALQNLGGVVQLILGSSTACAWATADYRWTIISNTEAEGDGLCQVLYYRTFQADERLPYRFRWFVTVPYDIRTYVISNVSAVDVASHNSGNGTTLTASGVMTTEVGDYFMAFYASLGSGTWTQPSNMGVAVENDYAYSGPANFRNLATQAWAYPIGATGTETAAMRSSAQWVADLVAFKPLYRILIPGIAQPLATFGTCAPSVEGEMQTESNSTAACSLGATATSGGTTHCAIRCNGTNWIQTGL